MDWSSGRNGHSRDRRLSGFAAEKRPLTFHCPTPALQYLKDRLLESGEVIRNHELDTRQAALFQSQKEFLPTALALAFFGHLNGRDLPLTFPVDADGDQDGRPITPASLTRS